MLGLTWTVGTRRFRSWVPEEEEAYHFLIMWAPLSPKEQAFLELFEGLDAIEGNMPLEPPAIAALYGWPEKRVRAVLAQARKKVADHLKYNGLPFPIKKRTIPEPRARHDT